MIRPATHDDLPRLLELGRLMHEESRFATVSFDAEKVAGTLTALVDGGGCLLVAERDGEVIGGFAGVLVPYWFSQETMACDLALFVSPDRRGGMAAAALLKAFEAWAATKGAREACLGISTGVCVEATGRLFQRLGFVNQNPLFHKEIPKCA